MNRRELLGAAAGVASVSALAGAASIGAAEDRPLRVLCWSEKTEPVTVYPNGGNAVVAEFLNKVPGIHATTAYLGDPEQGVPDSVLENIDVLTWWGHQKHALVNDDLVKRVVSRINNNGLGFLALHSSHYSKILKATLKTSGDLGGGWTRDGEGEQVYVVNPAHPVAKGVTDFHLDQEEMYDEPFGIPEPHHLVFFSVFGKQRANGEHCKFRSGCGWEVGKGRLFYFRPGHEEYPTYHHPMVQKIVTNAVQWVARKTG